jgi:hypothetical protein
LQFLLSVRPSSLYRNYLYDIYKRYLMNSLFCFFFPSSFGCCCCCCYCSIVVVDVDVDVVVVVVTPIRIR